MSKPIRFAVMPAADGIAAVVTTHKATQQGALTGGADAATLWLQSRHPESLPCYLNAWLCRLPGGACQAFMDGFLLRIEQRLLAQRTEGVGVAHDD